MSQQSLELVVLRGSQVNLLQTKEQLPISAGLPSAAGLFRSPSVGGITQKKPITIEPKHPPEKLEKQKKVKVIKKRPVKKDVQPEPTKLHFSSWSSNSRLKSKPNRKKMDLNSIGDTSISMKKLTLLPKETPEMDDYLKKRAVILQLNEIARTESSFRV